MALPDPLPLNTFADELCVSSVKWYLKDNQEFSGLGNGQILAADLAPRLWTAEVTVAPRKNADMDDLQALIESLDGSIRSFYLYAPQHPYPRKDPKGSILGSSVVTINSLGVNNKSMSLAGLPANYELSRGDFLAFDYGTNPVRRAFHRIMESTTASGAGVSPVFEVRPHFRTGVTTGITVALAKPAARMIIIPDTFDSGIAQPVITNSLSFNAKQRL